MHPVAAKSSRLGCILAPLGLSSLRHHRNTPLVPHSPAVAGPAKGEMQTRMQITRNHLCHSFMTMCLIWIKPIANDLQVQLSRRPSQPFCQGMKRRRGECLKVMSSRQFTKLPRAPAQAPYLVHNIGWPVRRRGMVGGAKIRSKVNFRLDI